MLALWLTRGDRGDEPLVVESRSFDDPELSTPNVESAAELRRDPGTALQSTPRRTEPNLVAFITKQRRPDIEVPPWADEMESAILSYIAQYPKLALTNLQVQCADAGCVILMGGDDIPVYDMNFDVFASDHGFNGALIGGDSRGARTVFLRGTPAVAPE